METYKKTTANPNYVAEVTAKNISHCGSENTSLEESIGEIIKNKAVIFVDQSYPVGNKYIYQNTVSIK